jgi:hypothetical protein
MSNKKSANRPATGIITALFILSLVTSVTIWWKFAWPVLGGVSLTGHEGHIAIIFTHTLDGTFMLGAGGLALYIGWKKRWRKWHKVIGIGIIPLNQESCDPNANNIPCKFSQHFRKAMNGAKTGSADLFLNARLDDPIWIQFRSHISYRAMGAFSNLQRSKKTLEETEELSKKLENI